MTSGIISHELLFRCKRPLTYVLIATMLYQGISYSRSVYDRIINEGLWVNASAIAHVNLAGVGFLLFVIVAIITGSAIYRDLEHRTAELIYTCPTHEKRFFLKKFAAALLINLVISLGYVAGMLLVPWLPSSADVPIGPAPLGQMASSFALFMVPNLFLLTSVSIALVVVFRQITASYIGVAVLMVLLLVVEFVRENTTHLTLVLLLDPFAFGITREVVDVMSVEQKNSAYFPLSPILIANRLVWLSTSCLFFLLAYRQFSFKRFIAGGVRERHMPGSQAVRRGVARDAPSVELQYSRAVMLKRLFRWAWRDFVAVTRPASFRIIIAVLMIMTLFYHTLWSATDFIEPASLPLTYNMAIAREPLSIYIFVLLAIWTVELSFKDRTARTWEVTESLPVPSWVLFASRLITMGGVALIFVLALLVIGIAVQLGRGFTEMGWLLYAEDLLLYRIGWLTYLQIVGLALFAGAVTNNRYAAHALVVGVVLFVFVAKITGMVEQYSYLYGYVPGIEDFSEMNGYGVLGISSFWYGALWTFLAGALVVAALGLWNRGAPRSLVTRLTQAPRRLSYAGVAILVAMVAGCGFVWQHIQHNVYDLADYQTSAGERDEAAAYEMRYGGLQLFPQPVVTHVNLHIDLHPDERRADVATEMTLTNETTQAINVLHIEHPEFTRFDFWLAGSAERAAAVPLTRQVRDEALRHSAYRLPVALAPGETLLLLARGRLQYVGFTQGEIQGNVTFDGSFAGSELLPQIGYQPGRRLLENRERMARGLTRLVSRRAPQDDPVSSQRSVFSRSSRRATARITVSAPASQTVFGPGELIERRVHEGRSFASFAITDPEPLNWRVGSAGYATRSFEINVAGRPVQVEMFHDAAHVWNVDHVAAAVDATMSFIHERLGPYPYPHLRIAEIPFHAGASPAYTNVIAVPENEGWLGEMREPADAAYIHYVIARGLAEIVLSHRLDIADVQGAGVFTRAIPEYYALQFVRARYGESVYAEALSRKQDQYKRGRGGEPNTEPSLLYADGASYVEADKGPIVFSSLADCIGGDALDRALSSFVARYAGTGRFVNSTDLWRDLERELPAGCGEDARILFLRSGFSPHPDRLIRDELPRSSGSQRSGATEKFSSQAGGQQSARKSLRM